MKTMIGIQNPIILGLPVSDTNKLYSACIVIANENAPTVPGIIVPLYLPIRFKPIPRIKAHTTCIIPTAIPLIRIKPIY